MSEARAPASRMNLNPLTLAFRGGQRALEAPFRKNHVRESLLQVRAGLFMAMLAYGGFGIVDALIAPQIKTQLWLIRFAIILPTFLLVILLSFSSLFDRLMQPLLALAILVAGGGIVAMAPLVPPGVRYDTYAGIIVTLIFGLTLVRARFIWAVPAGWLIIAAHQIALFHSADAYRELIINGSTAVLCVGLAGSAACYAIEYALRKQYYLNQLLAGEQTKVDAANRELESRVTERTTQLSQERRRAQQLYERQVIVTRLSLALREFRDIHRLHRIIYEHICELMDAKAFIISTYDADEGLIRAEYALVPGGELDVSLLPPIPLEESGAARKARSSATASRSTSRTGKRPCVKPTANT